MLSKNLVNIASESGKFPDGTKSSLEAMILPLIHCGKVTPYVDTDLDQ